MSQIVWIVCVALYNNVRCQMHEKITQPNGMETYFFLSRIVIATTLPQAWKKVTHKDGSFTFVPESIQQSF